MAKRISRRRKVSAAKLRQVREQFQQTRPSLSDLIASGEYTPPIRHGDYLSMKRIAAMLKSLRKQSGLSLATVAESTGMDRATISRLENGIYENVTIQTLDRIFSAFGKRVVFALEDVDRVD